MLPDWSAVQLIRGLDYTTGRVTGQSGALREQDHAAPTPGVEAIDLPRPRRAQVPGPRVIRPRPGGTPGGVSTWRRTASGKHRSAPGDWRGHPAPPPGSRGLDIDHCVASRHPGASCYETRDQANGKRSVW